MYNQGQTKQYPHRSRRSWLHKAIGYRLVWCFYNYSWLFDDVENLTARNLLLPIRLNTCVANASGTHRYIALLIPGLS